MVDISRLQLTYIQVANSTKASHQHVTVNAIAAGEVWHEQIMTQSLSGKKLSVKRRWFAKTDDGVLLGRGTQVAMRLGAGYPAKQQAVEALIAGRESKFNNFEARLK